MIAEPILSLAASVAAEHSVQGVLDSIVRGLASQPHVALARTAGSLNLKQGESLDSFFRQRFFDLVKFERFEDRFNLLHQPPPRVTYFS